MIRSAITALAAGKDLSYEQTQGAMESIMTGQSSPVQMSSFLTALALKGETITEITACATVMRSHCVRLLHEMEVLEIVGTGGDSSNSFNISTTASLVIAAAGVPVAKHGNRAASSRSGSADVLEALGVDISVSPGRAVEILQEVGICFLFAQNYHIAMRYVAPVRRELGIRTVFNIIGPLANPAGAKLELMGVYDPDLVEPLAEVMHNLGVKRGMVVHGRDGLDEISVSAPTLICEIRGDSFHTYEISPEDFGMQRCELSDLEGGSPLENAAITRAILQGESGPRRNAVVLNAAAALVIAGACPDMDAGVQLAAETIDSGKATATLDAFIAASAKTTEN